MPHLATHMGLARDLAAALANKVIDSDRGAFYMGAAGPDMHVLNGSKRHASHFFHLDELGVQDSVAAFFETYPGLRESGALTTAAAAFVGGYLTHLIMDELWITDIYRPFFGPAAPGGGDARANIMDRVLQYDMDLQRRRQREAMAEIREALMASCLDVGLDFVDEEDLLRWRDVAAEMLQRAPDWSRFRYLAGRFLANAGVDTEEKLEEFLGTVPDLLAEATNRVGEERLRAFREKVAAESLTALREYLP